MSPAPRTAPSLPPGAGGPGAQAVSPRTAAARGRAPPRLRGLSRLALLVLVVIVSVWVGTHVANGAGNGSAYSEHT